MSKKRKRRATVQPLRSVRTIREVGLNAYDVPQDPELNDGEEFQARDGSSLRTMAEAEAEERRDAREEHAARIEHEREQKELAADREVAERSIPEIIVSLTTSPFKLVVALFKIPFETRVRLARGEA